MTRKVMGARYGIKDWLLQRLTAVYMAFFTIVFFVRLCWIKLENSDALGFNYSAWLSIFQPAWFRFLFLLFFINLVYHAWVGVRDIWMDYIKNTKIRLVLHYLTVFGALWYVFWAVRVLWR